MHTIRLPYHDRYPYSPITERRAFHAHVVAIFRRMNAEVAGAPLSS
jgi:hypothetical protein